MKKEKKIPCEIWCRPVGYFRPVQDYNPSKQEEFWNRKYLNHDKIKKRLEDGNKTM